MSPTQNLSEHKGGNSPNSFYERVPAHQAGSSVKATLQFSEGF